MSEPNFGILSGVAHVQNIICLSDNALWGERGRTASMSLMTYV